MNFGKRVYELCMKIPKGKVSTYGEIAGKMKTKGYRAVGNALNKNKFKEVPCHRVVASNGHLCGFAGGLKKKAELLRKEGVEVRAFRVDLKRFLYKFR